MIQKFVNWKRRIDDGKAELLDKIVWIGSGFLLGIILYGMLYALYLS